MRKRSAPEVRANPQIRQHLKSFYTWQARLQARSALDADDFERLVKKEAAEMRRKATKHAFTLDDCKNTLIALAYGAVIKSRGNSGPNAQEVSSAHHGLEPFPSGGRKPRGSQFHPCGKDSLDDPPPFPTSLTAIDSDSPAHWRGASQVRSSEPAF